jgi:hypothetical protein
MDHYYYPSSSSRPENTRLGPYDRISNLPSLSGPSCNIGDPVDFDRLNPNNDSTSPLSGPNNEDNNTSSSENMNNEDNNPSNSENMNNEGNDPSNSEGVNNEGNNVSSSSGPNRDDNLSW